MDVVKKPMDVLRPGCRDDIRPCLPCPAGFEKWRGKGYPSRNHCSVEHLSEEVDESWGEGMTSWGGWWGEWWWGGQWWWWGGGLWGGQEEEDEEDDDEDDEEEDDAQTYDEDYIMMLKMKMKMNMMMMIMMMIMMMMRRRSWGYVGSTLANTRLTGPGRNRYPKTFLLPSKKIDSSTVWPSTPPKQCKNQLYWESRPLILLKQTKLQLGPSFRDITVTPHRTVCLFPLEAIFVQSIVKGSNLKKRSPLYRHSLHRSQQYLHSHQADLRQ